jgi:hypothetical protein
MAFGTGKVPVQEALAPVKGVLGADVFVRIEVIPALTAISSRTRIPGYRKCLLSSVGEIDEVLLQRPHAERMGYPQGFGASPGGFDAYHEVPVLPVKAHRFVEIPEIDAAEITENRLIARKLHCTLVIRPMPIAVFGGMAALTPGAADEFGFGSRMRAGRRRLVASANRRGDACHGCNPCS